MKILVVEDDAICRGMMEGLLQLRNHETRVCRSGEEALSWLGRETFDLLITDFRMPGMDGLTLIGKARVVHPGLATVLMTGVPREDLTERLNQSAGTAFFPKPMDWGELSLFLGTIKVGEESG